MEAQPRKDSGSVSTSEKGIAGSKSGTIEKKGTDSHPPEAQGNVVLVNDLAVPASSMSRKMAAPRAPGVFALAVSTKPSVALSKETHVTRGEALKILSPIDVSSPLVTEKVIEKLLQSIKTQWLEAAPEDSSLPTATAILGKSREIYVRARAIKGHAYDHLVEAEVAQIMKAIPASSAKFEDACKHIRAVLTASFIKGIASLKAEARQDIYAGIDKAIGNNPNGNIKVVLGQKDLEGEDTDALGKRAQASIDSAIGYFKRILGKIDGNQATFGETFKEVHFPFLVRYQALASKIAQKHCGTKEELANTLKEEIYRELRPALEKLYTIYKTKNPDAVDLLPATTYKDLQATAEQMSDAVLLLMLKHRVNKATHTSSPPQITPTASVVATQDPPLVQANQAEHIATNESTIKHETAVTSAKEGIISAEQTARRSQRGTIAGLLALGLASFASTVATTNYARKPHHQASVAMTNNVRQTTAQASPPIPAQLNIPAEEARTSTPPQEPDITFAPNETGTTFAEIDYNGAIGLVLHRALEREAETHYLKDWINPGAANRVDNESVRLLRDAVISQMVNQLTTGPEALALHSSRPSHTFKLSIIANNQPGSFTIAIREIESGNVVTKAITISDSPAVIIMRRATWERGRTNGGVISRIP